jgi:shikimate dehydrogenase
MEKHFAVIGHPIAHSLSPVMHRAGYHAIFLNADYQRFDVMPEDLEDAVKGLKGLGFSGWNVTVPYKEKILPFLDELTQEAQRAGAVNTVKVSEGRLIGHNTDGTGFVCSLQNKIKLEPGKNVVLLGAGGAARGIAMALAPLGVQLTILNRTPERASKLVASIRDYGGRAEVIEWGSRDWVTQADCIIQTTSIGLKNERYPLSLEGISPDTLVVDIIFNPWETSFLQQAQEKGCRTLNGVEMLLYQGVLAWEYWLGGQAPVKVMRDALYSALHQDVSI